MSPDELNDLVDLFRGAGFDVESQQRLCIRHPQVEPTSIAEVDGPEAGLRIVDALSLDDYRYLHSTRAELLRRLGRLDEARAAYRRARTSRSQ